MNFYSTLWVYIIFCFHQNAFCQNVHKIDSLKGLLGNNISNEQKVDIYNEISRAYGSEDSVEVTSYSQKALELSEQIGYHKGIVDTYYELGWLMLRKGHYQQAQEIYQKSLKISQEHNYERGKGRAYRNLGIINSRRGNYQEALELHQKSLIIFEKIQDMEGIGYANNNIGIIKKNKGEYSNALTYYYKSVGAFKAIDDLQGLGYTYNNIGIAFKNQGKYGKALEAYLKALKFFEKSQDIQGLVYIYNNVGLIYNNQEIYPKALEYYQKSLAIKQKIGDKPGTAKTLSNIARIFEKSGNISKAQEFYEQSLSLRMELGDKNGIANVYVSLGKLLLLQQEYKQAENYFKQALELREEMQEKASLPDAYINLGISFFYQNEQNKAQAFLEKGMDGAFQVGNPEIIRNGAEFLTQVYAAKGDHKKAYENHIIFKQMSDSLLNEESIRNTTKLEDKYTFSKVEDSLKIVQAQERAFLNDIIQQKEKVQTTTLIGLSLAFLLMIVLGYFFYDKQKTNKELNELNEELQTSNEEMAAAHEITSLLNENLNETLNVVQEQNEKIAQSISYAQRIQMAMLPTHKRILMALPEHFIFFQPRDVVSGDFYWFREINGKIYIAVVDCTGHGIPGAFVSMVGNESLNKIVKELAITDADLILNQLNLEIQQTLNQSETKNQDGMDLGLVVIDEANHTIEFAGAKRPLIYIQNNELHQVKGDSHSIGGAIYDSDFEKSFTKHTIPTDTPTTFYLFSDGYPDQFGGKKKKKFMAKQLRNLLLDIHQKPMDVQCKIVEDSLTNWMEEGDEEQVDDILVVGVRVNT